MGFPEGSNGKTILWIHHKVPSKIIKHDGILFIVELQKTFTELIILTIEDGSKGNCLLCVMQKPQEAEPISDQVACNQRS